MVDSLKSKDTQCQYEKVSANNDDVKISYDQNKYNLEMKNVPDHEVLQNALELLQRKRHDLYSQICSMEDMLALYEDLIERIREGGDVGLAHKCTQSILSGNNNHLMMNTNFNFPWKCEDLEKMCLENGWRLPRYFIYPSHGKFFSNVFVKSNDFELSLKGSLESSPIEARVSAAAQMITKIQNTCAKDT
ncbi:hypothetical protein ACJIZ3_020874 [Penstemon smallii]|uniref:Uncharacterized protein n=1 Tax=Penstemon smallii TaxID=265156 RepID=A0ABD3SKG4_9LAMI